MFLKVMDFSAAVSVGVVMLVLAVVPAQPALEPVGQLPERIPLAGGFGYPVGWPDGEGYYDAQDYTRNQHLGEDWNGVGGGATDRGDPVHAIGTGVVVYAADAGRGWGNVVIVRHRFWEEQRIREIESLYGHLAEVHVGEGQILAPGEVLGTIGDADGLYIPHLHFELRTETGLPPGPGYGDGRHTHLDPSTFIDGHRTTGPVAREDEPAALR